MLVLALFDVETFVLAAFVAAFVASPLRVELHGLSSEAPSDWSEHERASAAQRLSRYQPFV